MLQRIFEQCQRDAEWVLNKVKGGRAAVKGQDGIWHQGLVVTGFTCWGLVNK